MQETSMQPTGGMQICWELEVLDHRDTQASWQKPGPWNGPVNGPNPNVCLSLLQGRGYFTHAIYCLACNISSNSSHLAIVSLFSLATWAAFGADWKNLASTLLLLILLIIIWVKNLCLSPFLYSLYFSSGIYIYAQVIAKNFMLT